MANPTTPLALTQALLRFVTVNPPGNEHECARFVAGLLEAAGYRTSLHAFAPQRTSIIATLDGSGDALPLCFTGHLDVVPLGQSAWQRDPFAGEVAGDKLYGRGSTDMKGGVAALVLAAQRLARLPKRKAGLVLVLTAGEETACTGARFLADTPGVLGRAGAIVVGEPTSNQPLIGHRGVLWLRANTRGKTAHGSMPHEGDNAIHKAARAILRLQKFDCGGAHPLLGPATYNVGTIAGGENINSVPDHASFTIDLRTTPLEANGALQARLAAHLGDEVELQVIDDAPAVASDPAQPWVEQVFTIMESVLGEAPRPGSAPYFTDASALTPAMGMPPTVILGPGEAHMAHKTDEFCFISRLDQALEAYVRIGEAWVDNMAC